MWVVQVAAMNGMRDAHSADTSRDIQAFSFKYNCFFCTSDTLRSYDFEVIH